MEQVQYYEYNVDVKNDGTIDAMIGSLSNTSLDTNQAKYLNYTVTYSDGASIEQYDKLDSGETVTLKVRVEFKTNLNPEDLPTETSAVTLTYTSNYVQADENAKNRNTVASLNIGDSVNYVTSMNGVTLDNWKVFYVDGDYTILIYGDYLVNTVIDVSKPEFSNLVKSSYEPTYGIYAANYERIPLLEALQIKSNWSELLTGTVNGISIDYSGIINANIWAMGAPTIDLWVDSWNSTYPEDTIYTAQTATVMNDGLNGYYAGLNMNPTDPWIDLNSMVGYNDTLFYPHQEKVGNCIGYWIASPSSRADNQLMHICYDGSAFSYFYYSYDDKSLRPVVSLPTSILE